MNRCARPILVLTLVALGAASVCHAADRPAALAPKDSLLYLGVPNCDALAAAFKKTATWRMKNDPVVEDAIKPWMNVADKLLKLAAKKLGLEDSESLEVYPHGALAMYLSIEAVPENKDEEVRVGAAIVADMGDDAPRMKTLIDAIVAKCVEKGARKEVQEVAGGKLTVVHFKTEAEPSDEEAPAENRNSELANEIIEILQSEELGLNEMMYAGVQEALSEVHPPEEMAFAQRGSKFVAAIDEKSARKTLKLLRGDEDGSLAATGVQRTIKRHCDGEAHIQMAFNVPALVSFLRQADPEESPDIIRAMALEEIGPAVMTLAFAPGAGVESHVRGFLEIKNAKQGLGRMLMMKNTPLKPVTSVSSDVLSYGHANIDIPGIVDEVIEIATRIDPQEGEAMRAGMRAPQPDGSVLDIRKDILEYLSGPLFGSFTAQKPYGPDDLNFVVGLKHKSREALDKLTAMVPPGLFIPRDMMGAVVYDVPMVMGLAMGLTDRAVLLMGTKGAIEGYIRAEGKSEGSLVEDPTFRRLAKMVPKACCVMLYMDNRSVYDAQLAIIKSGTVTEQPPMFGSPVGAYLRWFLGQNDIVKALDQPEALRKYQPVNLTTVSTESDGLRMDSITMLHDKSD